MTHGVGDAAIFLIILCRAAFIFQLICINKIDFIVNQASKHFTNQAPSCGMGEITHGKASYAADKTVHDLLRASELCVPGKQKNGPILSRCCMKVIVLQHVVLHAEVAAGEMPERLLIRHFSGISYALYLSASSFHPPVSVAMFLL